MEGEDGGWWMHAKLRKEWVCTREREREKERKRDGECGYDGGV